MGRGRRILEIRLNSFGSFLGMDKGCLVIRDKEGKTKKYPVIESEIGEVILTSGNTISTGALSSLAFWGINCLIQTKNGMPVAIIKNLKDESHVETRIRQYEAVRNGKGFEIAKRPTRIFLWSNPRLRPTRWSSRTLVAHTHSHSFFPPASSGKDSYSPFFLRRKLSFDLGLGHATNRSSAKPSVHCVDDRSIAVWRQV